MLALGDTEFYIVLKSCFRGEDRMVARLPPRTCFVLRCRQSSGHRKVMDDLMQRDPKYEQGLAPVQMNPEYLHLLFRSPASLPLIHRHLEFYTAVPYQPIRCNL